ncbi:hypothetical protein EPUS_06606 [Endocarpon pusillum Z07020]|uniref:Uncharacterized protein n=1 Tax=Endocarpon pusillum (strain Z07020 / HMAS-L-300199) TaxID=1263415 RepID=U1GQ19_ENDPU|nr:uncharacterized protein EPUS_06606 [Endocarpon pusillum Z07020]ERF74428.1 hypothetical protein EPUS_06606 [Endocarpon pusillum Z07020]
MSDTPLSLVLGVLAFCRRFVLPAEMMADESHKEAPILMDLPWVDDEGAITNYKCPPPELEKIRCQYQLLPSEEGDCSDDESTPLLGSAEDWEPPSPALPDEGTGSLADKSTPLLGSESDGETFQPAPQSEDTGSSSSPPPLDQDDDWGPYQRALPKEETDLITLDPTSTAPSTPAVDSSPASSNPNTEHPPEPTLQNHTPQSVSVSNPHPPSSIQDPDLDPNSVPPVLALSSPTSPCFTHDLEKYDLLRQNLSDKVDRLHKILCAGDDPVCMH